jgi:hypothetical protein
MGDHLTDILGPRVSGEAEYPTPSSTRAIVRCLSLAAAMLAGGASAALGCFSNRGEGGVDTASLPSAIQGDYAMFARRCSKCHSLARPLTAGITDDEFWREYVERMRRQPASGITRSDEEPILRFLHYWSHRERRPLEGGAEDSP